MDFRGFSWIFMDFHGFSWIFMDVCQCVQYDLCWVHNWSTILNNLYSGFDQDFHKLGLGINERIIPFICECNNFFDNVL